MTVQHLWPVCMNNTHCSTTICLKQTKIITEIKINAFRWRFIIFLYVKYYNSSSNEMFYGRQWCINGTIYRKTSSIGRTKSQNLNVSNLVLQLSLLNPLKPGVKSRMKV